MRRGSFKISFSKFLLILVLFIMLIVGIAIISVGDKKSGIEKDEYYIAGGVLISFCLTVFVLGKLTGTITFYDIMATFCLLSPDCYN